MAHHRRAGALRGTWRAGSAEMAAISRDRKCSVGLRSAHYRRNDTARPAGAMKMQKRGARVGCEGFTLVEVLAALAIASVIIMASAALIRNVALFFDRGTRGVTEAERLMLAVERLAGDFGSARFVWRRATWPGPRARFEDVTLQDPVVLIEGKVNISFVFGRVTPEGALAWYASW